MAVNDFDDQLKRKARFMEQTPGVLGRGTARGLRESVNPVLAAATPEERLLKGAGVIDERGSPVRRTQPANVNTIGAPRVDPSPQAPGFFQRIFGGEQQPPAQAPAPQPQSGLRAPVQLAQAQTAPAPGELLPPTAEDQARTAEFAKRYGVSPPVAPASAAPASTTPPVQDPLNLKRGLQRRLRESGASLEDPILTAAHGGRFDEEDEVLVGEEGPELVKFDKKGGGKVAPLGGPMEGLRGGAATANTAMLRRTGRGRIVEPEDPAAINQPVPASTEPEARLSQEATRQTSFGNRDATPELSDRNVVQGLRGGGRFNFPEIGQGAFGSLAALGAFGAQSRLQASRAKQDLARDVARNTGLRSDFNAVTARRQVETQERVQRGKDVDSELEDHATRIAGGLKGTGFFGTSTEKPEEQKARVNTIRATLKDDLRHTLAKHKLGKVENTDPATRQVMYAASSLKERWKKSNDEGARRLRDYFGTSVDSKDLLSFMPKLAKASIVPFSGGYTITLKNGNKIDIRDAQGGGFNLFGSNKPVDADVTALFLPLIEKFKESQKSRGK